MKKTVFLALLIGSFAVTPAMAQTGEELYLKMCGTCHGKQGEGNPAMAKMLKVDIKPLTAAEVQAKSDAELIKAMVEGIGTMKPVKDITEDKAKLIVAFMRELAK